MRIITIRAKPGNPSQGLLQFGQQVFQVAIGRNGMTSVKREGDGATPIGQMRMIAVHIRRDRHACISTRLPVHAIGARDGWCDAPAYACYNRPVHLPFSASHEVMQRNDHLYDHVVVLDWNFTRRRRYGGSAIFLHLARPGFQPTEGCVAVRAHVMRQILTHASQDTVIEIRR